MPDDDLEAASMSPARLARLARFGAKRLHPAELFDAWLFAETKATLANWV